MMTVYRCAALTLAIGALTACGDSGLFQRTATPDEAVQTPDAETVRPETRPDLPVDGLARTALRTAETLDQTTAAERAAATAPGAGGAPLGETLASLGNPAEGGFWLRTGLVTDARQGRVVTQGGATVQLELRPSGNAPGAGSQLSLPAFRALDLPLTDLPRLTVFGG